MDDLIIIGWIYRCGHSSNQLMQSNFIFNFSYPLSIMEFKQKVQSMYRSGRYECDYDFYVRLSHILQYLNIYQWKDTLETQIKLVKDIRDLAEANSKSLQEDYNEEEAVSQTHVLKTMIGHLNIKDIPRMIQDCDSQGWQSLESKLHRQLRGDGEYEQIIERIKTTIHSQQLRIDSMMFVGCFQAVHGNRVSQIVQIYCSIIDYYLNFMSEHRITLQLLGESSEFSNICALPKIASFVQTLLLILKAVLRFCEIVKVLTGKSSLSLKFTNVKKELEKVIKGQWSKQELFSILPAYREYLKNPTLGFSRESLCRWCFKPLVKTTHQHFFCHEIIAKKSQFALPM